MDFATLQRNFYTLNEKELYYREYYYAKQQEYSLKKFLANVDVKYLIEKNIIIPEFPQTVPPVYEDYWMFEPGQNIVAIKHNCYTPPHEHDHTFFELTYVYEGRCSQVINGRPLEMRTGDFLVIPPRVPHTIEVTDESVVIQIPVKANTLEQIFANFLYTDNILSMFFINSIYAKHVNDYIIFHSGDDYHIRTAATHLVLENINKESMWQNMMMNTLQNIFCLLLRNYEKSVELPSIISKADTQRFGIIRYIQSNYENCTLEMVAERFHYTPEYASKLIKEVTGDNFKHILQRIRIEKAQDLLLNTTMSVQSISDSIGYENPESFIRVFKQYTRTTPSNFRKREHMQ